MMGQEETDVGVLQARMGRGLEAGERARIGTGQLRRFLEQLLQRRCVLPSRRTRLNIGESADLALMAPRWSTSCEHATELARQAGGVLLLG